MMFNVTGLNFNQEYIFTVRAENRAGIGNSINVPLDVTGLGESNMLKVTTLITCLLVYKSLAQVHTTMNSF